MPTEQEIARGFDEKTYYFKVASSNGEIAGGVSAMSLSHALRQVSNLPLSDDDLVVVGLQE